MSMPPTHAPRSPAQRRTGRFSGQYPPPIHYAPPVPGPEPNRRTRLAPSPTGALHLGNARTFLINAALAHHRRWRVLLRIEDLDTPRTKTGADQQAIDMLTWLGLRWDEGPAYQSAERAPYAEALARLVDAGLAYRCPATRREIEAAASAPHADDHELRYPGLYRPDHLPRHESSEPGVVSPESASQKPARLDDADDRPTAWRVYVPDGPVAFHDELHGPRSVDVQQQVGDFIVHTKADQPAYQLAVVVDDHRQGVTDIVRGDDLLDATARQVYLYRVLGLGDPPRYWHVPLVLGPDGRRLAKRHGDTRLVAYRDAGVPADRVIGLLAWWSGIVDRPEPTPWHDFRDGFDLERLPRGPATFRDEDHRWLMQG